MLEWYTCKPSSFSISLNKWANLACSEKGRQSLITSLAVWLTSVACGIFAWTVAIISDFLSWKTLLISWPNLGKEESAFYDSAILLRSNIDVISNAKVSFYEVWRPYCKQCTFWHDTNPVSKFVCFFEIMGCKYDSFSLLLQFFDDRPDNSARSRIHRWSWLIEIKYLSSSDKRHCETKLSSIAAA